MKYKTYSEDYETIRLSYPLKLDNKCISCKSEVKFKYANDGKLVRTLDGIIHQVTNFYSCTNPGCNFSKVAFNPSAKYDYSERHFGADVFKMVAEEFLVLNQKPSQVHQRLNLKYDLQISIDTIRRMCDDILNLKALKIDEKTLEIIKNQKFILLGFDGQDPGQKLPSIWNFMDVVSNRVLATYKFDTLDFQILHETIEEIHNLYDVKIIGWVTDKQNLITKCHDVFYLDIPHQYCEYHFLNNTWSHLRSFDSIIFKHIKKTINKLYIHNASSNTTVFFENIGNHSVRKVFESIDKDLQKMTGTQNKRFKLLRGIILFEKLENYVNKMNIILDSLDPSFRFTKILSRTSNALSKALAEMRQNYKEAIELNEYFQSIRIIFGKDEEMTVNEMESNLDKIYTKIFSLVTDDNPKVTLNDCKSFLANKNSSKTKILGEWCRLWSSYRTGLFEYTKFPIKVKTNNGCENGFSKEKQAIFSRVAKSNVNYMISTRGEAYLRIKHCTEEELQDDIVEQYSDEIVKKLRVELQKEIKKITEYWSNRQRLYNGIKIAVTKYYKCLESM